MSTLQAANIHLTTGGTIRLDQPTANTVRITVNSANVAHLTERGLTVTGNLLVTGVSTVPASYVENPQTGTSYTFVTSDAGKMVTSNNSSNVTFTIALNATQQFNVGDTIQIANYGTGNLIISNVSSVLLRSSGSRTRLSGQFSVATLWKRGTDEWLLLGDIV